MGGGDALLRSLRHGRQKHLGADRWALWKERRIRQEATEEGGKHSFQQQSPDRKYHIQGQRVFAELLEIPG